MNRKDGGPLGPPVWETGTQWVVPTGTRSLEQGHDPFTPDRSIPKRPEEGEGFLRWTYTCTQTSEPDFDVWTHHLHILPLLPWGPTSKATEGVISYKERIVPT